MSMRAVTEMIHATEPTLLYQVPGVDPGFYSFPEFRTECSKTQTGFRTIPMGDHHLGYIQSEIVSEFVNFVFNIFSEFCNKFDLKWDIWNYVSKRKNK